jgi:hypothetical protein
MSHTHDVFLCYSKRDEPVVRDLARRLRDRRLRVWFDGWEMSPGDSIPSRIEAGLEGSAVLVLCVSEHSLGSDWAMLESQTFRFRDPLNRERRFIPLRLDDAPLKGSLAQFLYIDWRNHDDYEFERLVRACRTVPAESDGHPGDPAPERVALRIGVRHARFDVPHGWEAQSAAKISEIQGTEGDQATVHAALHHPGASPELIYALTIWSAAMPASMLAPENISQLVLAAEQHTGLNRVSDVIPVSLDGAAGWLWHLQGVVPGALFGRPQVATMDVHCSEMWASVDAFTAIKMLLTAPRAIAHEAADGLSSVIFSWQWGPPAHTTPPFAEAVRASEEMAPPPVSSEGRPASAPATDAPPLGQEADSGGSPSEAFPSLAPLLARAAHRTMALMIAGDPLKNKRGDEIEHFVGWLDLGSKRVPQRVPSAAVAATGLSSSRLSALISNAIGLSRRTPRAHVGLGIDVAALNEPGLLHFDMTGTCMDDHVHVTWDPVSADCGEVLLAAQTLADVSADPGATWSPPPDAQAAAAINGRTLQVMTIVGAVLWAAAREGWDMQRAVEQFSEEYFPSVLSMCEDMAAQTGKGSALCKRVAEFRDTPQQALSAVVHDALDPLSGIIRATQSGLDPARLDLSSWLSGTGLLAITVPEEPTIAQLGVVNALLGAADALGWTRPGYLPPTVVWEGIPSPRHGLAMPSPWWLGIFDDGAEFLIWSELLNTQTPQHGCDWLIGAGTNEALLMRLAQDTTPPRGDQRVLVHSDTDTFLLLD